MSHQYTKKRNTHDIADFFPGFRMINEFYEIYNPIGAVYDKYNDLFVRTVAGTHGFKIIEIGIANKCYTASFQCPVTGIIFRSHDKKITWNKGSSEASPIFVIDGRAYFRQKRQAMVAAAYSFLIGVPFRRSKTNHSTVCTCEWSNQKSGIRYIAMVLNHTELEQEMITALEDYVKDKNNTTISHETYDKAVANAITLPNAPTHNHVKEQSILCWKKYDDYSYKTWDIKSGHVLEGNYEYDNSTKTLYIIATMNEEHICAAASHIHTNAVKLLDLSATVRKFIDSLTNKINTLGDIWSCSKSKAKDASIPLPPDVITFHDNTAAKGNRKIGDLNVRQSNCTRYRSCFIGIDAINTAYEGDMLIDFPSFTSSRTFLEFPEHDCNEQEQRPTLNESTPLEMLHLRSDGKLNEVMKVFEDAKAYEEKDGPNYYRLDLDITYDEPYEISNEEVTHALQAIKDMDSIKEERPQTELVVTVPGLQEMKKKALECAKWIAVDFEMRTKTPQKICFMSIISNRKPTTVYIVNTREQSIRKEIFNGLLHDVFESKETLILTFGSESLDFKQAFYDFGIKMRHVLDIQVFDSLLRPSNAGKKGLGAVMMERECWVEVASEYNKTKRKLQVSAWDEIDLEESSDERQYLEDVHFLPVIMKNIKPSDITPESVKNALHETLCQAVNVKPVCKSKIILSAEITLSIIAIEYYHFHMNGDRALKISKRIYDLMILRKQLEIRFGRDFSETLSDDKLLLAAHNSLADEETWEIFNRYTYSILH